MVTTGGPSAGGSGFEYGENTVAARLSIDIPTEGVQSLREITQEISRFRTEMEAAARSQGDFIGFFQTLPSIASQAASAFKTYADELERGLALQQRMQGAVGQWDVQPGSTPDNFRGMTSGMGRSGPNDINQTVAEMDRMREMGPAGERQYLNVQQQHGAMLPGDMPRSNSANDIAAATERISARERINQERSSGGDIGGAGGRMGQGGIAREIMNELSVGGNQGGSITQILRRGTDYAAEKARASSGGGQANRPSGAVPAPDSGTSGAVGADEGMGGAGGILSLLGRGLGAAGGALGIGALGPLGAAASIAGLGLTGFSAAQFLGPKVQNLKDQGLVEGGGAKEGFGQEMQARIMGLSPFLSNDQSRSIIQSALRDGYTGKEYETVTKFMADNIKDFAMTVGESREVVAKQMVQQGATPEGIRAELEQQKNLSKGSYLSFPDRKNALLGLEGQMADAGVSKATSSKASAQALEMFSDSQIGKGLGADMMSGAMSGDLGTQGAFMAMAGITPDADFSNWGEQIASMGSDGQQRILSKLARDSKGNIGVFRMMLQNFLGMSNVTIPQARYLYEQGMGGKASSKAKSRLSGGGTEIKDRSGAATAIAGASGGISALGGMASDLVTGNWGNIAGRDRDASWQTADEHIPLLDKLVQSQGGDPNKIEVQDGSGNWKKLQSGNKDQLEALSQGGKWKMAGEKGSGRTLAEAPSVTNSNFGKQNVEVGGQVKIHVSTDPGVSVRNPPRTFTITQNQAQANAGWGSATVNNPPPGDR